MPEERTDPAVQRIVRDAGDPGLVDRLAGGLAGTDLTTLLLAVAERRAAARHPADLLRQYQRDRFVRPGAVDPRQVLAVEHAALVAASPAFEPVQTSPLQPFAANAVVAGVSQNRVVTTMRGTDVAADPTMSLALEAAVRRRSLLAEDARSAEVVRLATVERVVRAQRFAGARSFAHFSALGLVSAGRDAGSHAFEIAELRRHVAALVSVLDVLDLTIDEVRVSDVSDGRTALLDQMVDALAEDGLPVTAWAGRSAGRGYYADLCIKVYVRVDDEVVEVGDGGAVRWTASLLGNAKERLLISGLGLERVAQLSPVGAP